MTDDLGRLVLRLGVGGLMLCHGVHKLFTGLDGVKSMLVEHKLPAALSYAVYAGEIVGPLLVVIGVFARFGALLIAAEVAALVALTGLAQALTLTHSGAYALEVEALYLAGALAILLLGPGKIAIAKGKYQ
jgi:putative oxidoreductase